MAYICLQAEECRIFIKNGKLRFQARKVDQNEEITEQVTVTLPQELSRYFTQVENLDEFCDYEPIRQNRISDLLRDS